ncbi:MAG: hypothetical protein KQA34_03255 [Candidatus Aenigmarchaeota archaeon]|nr:hypothetical protein [Candidatus Aenigmarchaeota archaeon]
MVNINIGDLEPIAYCIVIREVLDSKRFLKGFGDNVLLKFPIKEIEENIKKIRKELLSEIENKKHFVGIKTLLLDLLDRILAMSSRYNSINYALASEIQNSIKKIMRNITYADNFNDLEKLYEEFNRSVFLNMYKLFQESIKLRK